MSGPELTVGRGVIAELVRLAAFEVPGVARVGHGGPAWRGWLLGPSVSVRVRDERVLVRLRIVARPGHALVPLTGPGPHARSPRPWSGCSAWTWAPSPSSSMASEADRQRGRRTGRRLALAAIFEADFGQRTADAILERHLAESERDEVAAALARELVAAVVAHRDAIDARITEVAPQYPVTGLAKMDRALLRTAIGEVLHSGTPARVAIAEWVELARTYSGEPMRRLMNGVLGNIAG